MREGDLCDFGRLGKNATSEGMFNGGGLLEEVTCKMESGMKVQDTGSQKRGTMTWKKRARRVNANELGETTCN